MTTRPSHITFNLLQLDGMSDSELEHWMHAALGDDSFSPLIFLPEPSLNVQLQYLARHAQPTTRFKIEHAIEHVIARWHPLYDSTVLLQRAAILAADLRLVSAVRFLAERLLTAILPEPELQTSPDLLRTLIGVISGFAPHPGAYTALIQIYNERLLAPYAAQTFLGLCECQPERYHFYLPTLLQTITSGQHRFNLSIIFDSFLQIVPLPIVIDQMLALEPSALEELLYLLLVQKPPLIEILPDATAAYRFYDQDNRSYPLPLHFAAHEGLRNTIASAKRRVEPTVRTTLHRLTSDLVLGRG